MRKRIVLPPLFVIAERTGAVYKVNEEITFQVRASRIGRLEYSVDNGDHISSPEKLSGDIIRTSLCHPGFVLVKVTGVDENGKTVEAVAGAGVEPEKIRSDRPRPDDFDAFWNRELDRLHRLPLSIEEKKLETKLVPDGLTAYDVVIRRGSLVATGYLVIPENACPKSLPAVALFCGAGYLTARLPDAVKVARLGAVAFNLNFRGTKNYPRLTREKTAELTRTMLPYECYFRNAEDMDNNYFKKVFLRVVMAVDYLKSRAEFDGKHLIVRNGSLGGAQALAAAALVPETTCCIATAPAMCDHHGKRPGWPKLLKTVPRASDAADYIDMIHFTPKIKCRTVMSAGFIDPYCTPHSVYAAFNLLTTKEKKIYNGITCTHGVNAVKGRRSIYAYGNKEFLRALGKTRDL